MNTQINGLKVLTASDIKLPSRTLSVVSIQIDLKTVHGHIYDVNPIQAHKDEHPNMMLIPIIHKVDSACANVIPCVLINLSTEDIHLTKDEMSGFLLELNETTTMTIHDTLLYDEHYWFN